MSNPVKGEVTFEALGKAWRFKFSTNALCKLEEELGQGVAEFAAMLQGGGNKIGIMRKLLWCGLYYQHLDLTEAAVGDIIDDLGFEHAPKVIQKAFENAFPASQKGDTSSPKGTATP